MLPGFRSWDATWSCEALASCLTSLGLRFFTCKIEVMILPESLREDKRENVCVCKALRTVPGTEEALKKCLPLLFLISRGRQKT